MSTPTCNFSPISPFLSWLTRIKGKQCGKHSHLSYGGVTLTLSVWSNNNNAKTIECGMNINCYSILTLIIEIKVRIIPVTYSSLINNKDRKLVSWICTGI